MDVHSYTTSDGGTGAKFKGYTTLIAGAASVIATVVSVLFVPRHLTIPRQSEANHYLHVARYGFKQKIIASRCCNDTLFESSSWSQSTR